MRCYNLDDKTGAFFLNTGGYLASAGKCTSFRSLTQSLPVGEAARALIYKIGWFHKDCGNWVDTTYAGYTGKCYDKGDVRSIMVQ